MNSSLKIGPLVALNNLCFNLGLFNFVKVFIIPVAVVAVGTFGSANEVRL